MTGRRAELQIASRHPDLLLAGHAKGTFTSKKHWYFDLISSIILPFY